MLEGSWAVIGIVVGGLVSKLLNRPTELRTEIEGLRQEIRTLNVELKHWKGQFYFLLDATVRKDEAALHKLLSEYIGGEQNG
jgi:hypothetical protein